eukprot:6205073-Pleurochrysis_carterae.AAC.1
MQARADRRGGVDDSKDDVPGHGGSHGNSGEGAEEVARARCIQGEQLSVGFASCAKSVAKS